ncbi:molybdopterin-dependent oxidoreductase [Actinomycetospora corticicola]|uniref:DMSO/TMAO reductase YedYZ molybdopterin-dependent catalytic subunit n=1 Tax=Actinomycetospora corticicola TaxID=663602 RepID=A0A7Y9DXV0_9PSEU|nr:molybdopterin-dependent oxidoreductase [Actinomycetospora corticicola]NYD37534.1 DMSO/TMAO reductase YedYZ molybdopterin-dependent catalytic subunit [Actinomycetospora corticicola]
MSTDTDPPAGTTLSRRTTISSPVAAAIGVLAVGVALGLGDLVAALTAPPSSPFLAVGDQFIRLTPEALKEFATSTFGVHDKQVLLASMAVVIAAVAVIGGLLSRRSVLPGTVLVVVLGLVGLSTAVASPTFTAAYLIAPLVALVGGVATFVGLHRLALASGGATGAEPDVEAGYARNPRRRLALGLGAAFAGAAVTGLLGRVLAASGGAEASRNAVGPLPSPGGAPASPPPDADFAASGTPTWITPNADFYRIDTALQVPQVSASSYQLRIHGMVDREITLSYDQLRARAALEAPITMCCVSNDIGGNLISNAVFLGVPLRDLLAEAGVRPGADQIASTSVDGFTTGTPVAACTDGRNAMLALGMNGQPLPVEHGFPVRMVVPGLYGFVSGCKWITDIELTTFDAFQPYWQQRGWAAQAPVKTQSRIDAPRDGATVPAGRVVVAGTAWAQHRGVARVEVRADSGAWQTATLAAEVSIDTWRMWRAELDLSPGAHTLQVRATDATGATQPEAFSLTIPDGATGWHTVDITAR